MVSQFCPNIEGKKHLQHAHDTSVSYLPTILATCCDDLPVIVCELDVRNVSRMTIMLGVSCICFGTWELEKLK